MYIVLADDDIDDRELFTEALCSADLQVELVTVPDGEGLMSLLYSSTILPDLIFVDLNMPNKNGKECLCEIRESGLFGHIPIVIYSTSSSPRDIEETFECGANLYITKPSTFVELKSVICSVLAMKLKTQDPKADKKSYFFNKSY